MLFFIWQRQFKQNVLLNQSRVSSVQKCLPAVVVNAYSEHIIFVIPKPSFDVVDKDTLKSHCDKFD